jgi:hypothetical protein
MAGKMSLRTDAFLERFTDGESRMWNKYADKHLFDASDEITDAARKAFEYGFHCGRGFTEVVLREAESDVSHAEQLV